MKYFIITILIFITIIASGCGKEEVIMDELAEDGSYHYSNRDFKFSVTLPPEFIYYQTQRVTGENYMDIEFYVPTNDTKYPMTVPSYASPFKVRVLSLSVGEDIIKEYVDDADFHQMGKNKNFIYMVRFWDHVPVDWVDKWSDEIEDGIVNSFLIK